MLTLGIETSCDETSASVIDESLNILSNIISSQVDVHKKYGGVVPELASRRHIDNINIVLNDALDSAEKTIDDIDLIAVTAGPGLVGAILVGLSFAKALAFSKNIPLVPVNHIEGHILSAFLQKENIEFPFISLVASGGHTELYLAHDFCSYELLGATRDDAVGEAFDKVSKALGLAYPGGPVIEKLAREGNPEAITFPRAYISKDSLDFSYSGVKTAVKNYLLRNENYFVPDIAASFQAAAIDVLVSKLEIAVRRHNVEFVTCGGGVLSNSFLRDMITKRFLDDDVKVFFPGTILCTDNAAMIAFAGNKRFERFGFNPDDLFSIDANPRMTL